MRRVVQVIKGPTCRQRGETVAKCRTRKIRELVSEGRPQRQAVAAAVSICSRDCKDVESIMTKFDVDRGYAAAIASRVDPTDKLWIRESDEADPGMRLKVFDTGGLSFSRGESNVVIARITTDVVDRDREVIMASGVDFRNFRKNPVVLWMHRRDLLPVGRNLWPIKLADGGHSLVAKTRLSTKGMGAQIMDHLADGFPLAISIGLIPKVIEAPTSKEVKQTPALADADRIIREWELAEYSFVTVPANPEATDLLVQKGLLDDRIGEFMEHTPCSCNSCLTDKDHEPRMKRRVIAVVRHVNSM